MCTHGNLMSWCFMEHIYMKLYAWMNEWERRYEWDTKKWKIQHLKCKFGIFVHAVLRVQTQHRFRLRSRMRNCQNGCYFYWHSARRLCCCRSQKEESFAAHVAINNSKESENMWKEGFGFFLCVCSAVEKKDFAFSHIECLAMMLLWGELEAKLPTYLIIMVLLVKKGSKAFCRIRWF